MNGPHQTNMFSLHFVFLIFLPIPPIHAQTESLRFPPPTCKRLLTVSWEYLISEICAIPIQQASVAESHDELYLKTI